MSSKKLKIISQIIIEEVVSSRYIILISNKAIKSNR